MEAVWPSTALYLGPAYWLMMQVAMAIGLLTTYPVNAWLVHRGVKHPMGRPTTRQLATA